ncbi:NAD(P)/FAD-dependent oxidoreductase, partial [archaeon SCG-AAA382B04]
FINNSVDLSDYDRKWKRRIGKELKRGWLFHNTWSGFSDKQIDNFINDVNSAKIRDLINQFGDIDYPSKLFFKLLINKPSLLKFTIPLLKNYLKQIT